MQENNQNHVASNLPLQLALSLLSACSQLALSLLSACSLPEGGEVLAMEGAGCTDNQALVVRVVQIFTHMIRAST
jgi:hypothetical protein